MKTEYPHKAPSDSLWREPLGRSYGLGEIWRGFIIFRQEVGAMENVERGFQAELTLDEVDQINLDIGFVREFLEIVAEMEGHLNSTLVRKPAIAFEAMDRMKRIYETINPKPKSAQG
jgi:hypothetical protein